MERSGSGKPPRLKLNDVEIGLRHIGDQVYVPKNIQILKDVFYKKDIANQFNSQKFFYEKPISKIRPEKYHRIESFCFVATENVKEEAELLLSSLRLFHKQPVYVICDGATKKHLQQKNLTENVNFKLDATEEKLNEIQKSKFDNHICIANQIHHAPAILKKMDVMIWALKECNNTFFLDSDIIVLNSLQEYFTSSVVLSPHYYTQNKIHKGFEFGFYNAGYVFCANKGFPKYWKYEYLNDSTFFEQECMNRLPKKYKIQTFGKDHNVGFWRDGEFPQEAKSVHTHITEKGNANRGKLLDDLNRQTKNYALEQVKDKPVLNNYIRLHYNPLLKKLAFIHFGKAAGVYTQQYIRQNVMPNTNHFNSWWNLGYDNERALKRDWTEDELLAIAKKDVQHGFAHNHHINWTRKTVKAFNDNNWLTFMFIRNPKSILCSLYYWCQKQWDRWEGKDIDNTVLRQPLQGELMNMSGQPNPYKVSLNAFVQHILFDENAKHLWILPDYIDDIKYVAEFTDKNFGNFLLDNFQHNYVPKKKLNVSKSKGYETYLQQGTITSETDTMINNHPEYKRYLKYLD